MKKNILYMMIMAVSFSVTACKVEQDDFFSDSSSNRADASIEECINVLTEAPYGWKLRYFPRFVDENYINKILWDYKKGNLSGIDFYTSEHLITLPNIEFSVDSPHVFLVQKYDNSLKSSKKDF